MESFGVSFFFLLYAGLLVLKDILPDEYYKHFTLLSVSCIIFNCKESCVKYSDQAKSYLVEPLYGLESVSSNIHSVKHLAKDVINMGCSLSVTSAFLFESELRAIKNLLHSGNKPLVQVCNRMDQHMYNKNIKSQIFKIIKQKQLKSEIVIENLIYQDFNFKTKFPNNTLLTFNNEIIVINKIYSLNASVVTSENVFIQGQT